MSRDELIALLDKVLNDLGEHFDTVQICATQHEPEGTTAFNRGIGNFYARKASCQRFAKLDEAEDSAEILARAIRDDYPED